MPSLSGQGYNAPPRRPAPPVCCYYFSRLSRPSRVKADGFRLNSFLVRLSFFVTRQGLHASLFSLLFFLPAPPVFCPITNSCSISLSFVSLSYRLSLLYMYTASFSFLLSHSVNFILHLSFLFPSLFSSFISLFRGSSFSFSHYLRPSLIPSSRSANFIYSSPCIHLPHFPFSFVISLSHYSFLLFFFALFSSFFLFSVPL